MVRKIICLFVWRSDHVLFLSKFCREDTTIGITKVQWFHTSTLPHILILFFIFFFLLVFAYSLRFGLPKKFIWNLISLHLFFLCFPFCISSDLVVLSRVTTPSLLSITKPTFFITQWTSVASSGTLEWVELVIYVQNHFPSL